MQKLNPLSSTTPHQWDNSQATLHVYVTYYTQNNVLKNDSFLEISENAKHSAATVNLYNKKLIKHLKAKFSDASLQRIFYFSDGAGSQFKNKLNFFFILSHKSECGIEAEWHFFATSHGKGACKLQKNSQNQITFPKRLFDWAVKAVRAHQKHLQTKDLIFILCEVQIRLNKFWKFKGVGRFFKQIIDFKSQHIKHWSYGKVVDRWNVLITFAQICR